MPESKKLLQSLPKWARVTLTVVGLVGPVSGAAVTAVSSYLDLKSRALEASQKSEDGYETLAPALAEAQEIIAELEEVISEMDDEYNELKVRISVLEAYSGVVRLGATELALSPDAPTYAGHEAKEDSEQNGEKADEDLGDSDDSEYFDDDFDYAEMTAAKEPRIRRPARHVPLSIDQAQEYQEQRVKNACAPDDPICGAQ